MATKETWGNSRKREMPVVAIFLSSRSEPHPDQSELCLTLAHVPQRLVSVATRCVLSGRAAWRPSKRRQPVRITGISN